MYNPDYPTAQSAGFLQHTYQPTQQTDMFFYGGGMNPYAGMIPQADSRRNVGNPVNPFATFGQTQPPAVPESQVQPFASYPPSTPVPNQPLSLNSLIENSRRNAPPQPTAANIWAQSQQAPTPQTAAVFNAVPGANNGMYGYADLYSGYRIDMNTVPLYGDSSFGFDKRQSWENCYTQNRPIPMPAIDWRAQSNPAPAAYAQPIPPYPGQYFPSSQNNWREIAERNWGSASL